jgi:hypothetical protein
MKLSVVATFAENVNFSMPDPERPGVCRVVKFKARYRTVDASAEGKAKLEKIQEEEGLYGFLDKVLDSVEFDEGIEFEGANGETIAGLEFVKSSQLAQGPAAMKFWEVINKDVEAKNSKRSRGR